MIDKEKVARVMEAKAKVAVEAAGDEFVGLDDMSRSVREHVYDVCTAITKEVLRQLVELQVAKMNKFTGLTYHPTTEEINEYECAKKAHAMLKTIAEGLDDG